jgi:hypothetical protein
VSDGKSLRTKQQDQVFSDGLIVLNQKYPFHLFSPSLILLRLYCISFDENIQASHCDAIKHRKTMVNVTEKNGWG